MRTPFFVMLLLACAVAVAGCSKTDQSSTTTSESSPAAAPPAASPVASALAAAPASAAAAPAALPSAAFTDLDGVQGQKEIGQLAQLGVLDATSGPFHPGDSIKRRDFARWLFKTNNAVWADQPSRQVHPADATTQSSFSDLASSDPDFRYV